MKKLLIVFLLGFGLNSCKKDCPKNAISIIVTDCSSATIRWHPEVKTISVYYKDSSISGWKEIKPEKDSAYLPNLKSGTTYELRLRYLCKSKKYPFYADPVFFSTTSGPTPISVLNDFPNHTLSSLAFNGSNFYISAYNNIAFSYPYPSTIFVYEPYSAKLVDSFPAPRNTRAMAFNDKELWAIFDSTQSSYSTKFAKLSSTTGQILYEHECPIDLVKTGRILKAFGFEDGLMYLITKNNSGLCELILINPNSFLPVDSKSIIDYSISLAFKEQKLFMISAGNYLRSFKLDGTFLSITPLSKTSVPINGTQYLVTAFNDLYVITKGISNIRKIEKLTY